MSRWFAAVLLSAALLIGNGAALDHTHVTNDINVAIYATLTYKAGNSQFTDRLIQPGASGIDMTTHPGDHVMHDSMTIRLCTDVNRWLT